MKSKNDTYFTTIERFVNDYYTNNGTSPTIREIAQGTEIPRATVARYLNDMREKGTLSYNGHRSITTEQTRRHANTVQVPILGTVACGLPKLATENIEEYVQLPISIFGNASYFLLHAVGDSMIEAGISDGDLVLIKQQDYAKEGEIIVALIEEEATLKRYFPEPEHHRVRLQPENTNMSPIFVDSCIIQGVAVKVLKNLE